MLGPLAFFSIVTLLFAVLHLYLWARLVRSTTRPGRWRRIGTITIGALGLLGTVAFIVTRTISVDAWWLAWPGYVWLALMFYLLLVLLALELPRAVLTLWHRRRSEVSSRLPERVTTHQTLAPADPAVADTVATHVPATPVTAGNAGPSRRLFLSRTFALTAVVAASGTVGYGMRTAFGDLRAVRAAVPLSGLDPRMSGFRIALVSDTHFGPFIHREMAERIVTLVNSHQPDMVAIVGDLADGTVGEVGHAANPLRHLDSRHGTFFVTGNHDYSSGADEWIAEVRELGMRPLLNERVEIASGPSAFDLAGVNDLSARMYGAEGPDYAAALSDRDPSRPVILLAHQPVQVFPAMRHSVDLQLSGHTHGGQTVPFDRITGVQQPVVAGLARMGHTWIFVTRGAGFFGPPVRAGIPPEIAIVELQARG